MSDFDQVEETNVRRCWCAMPRLTVAKGVKMEVIREGQGETSNAQGRKEEYRERCGEREKRKDKARDLVAIDL